MATRQKHKERSRRSYKNNRDMVIQHFNSLFRRTWNKFRKLNH